MSHRISAMVLAVVLQTSSFAGTATGPVVHPSFEIVAPEIRATLLAISEDGAILVSDGTLISSYAASGMPQWQTDTSGILPDNITEIAFDESGQIHVASGNRSMAFDPATGSPVWPSAQMLADTAANGPIASTVLASGRILTETRVNSKGSKYGAAEPDGTVIWASDELLTGGFTDANEVFFAIAPQTNELLAIDIATGHELWRQIFAATISCPALGPDGAVFLIAGTDLLRSTPNGANSPLRRPSSAAPAPPQEQQQLSESGAFAEAIADVSVFAASAGLTAGYAFDEGTGSIALDASGNNLNGSLINGPTWGSGKYGNAVRLDGINDFVDLGNPAALQITGSMTISAWINSSTFPVDDAAIVSKRTAGEVGFQLDTTVDTGTRTIGFKLTTGSGGPMFRYGATQLAANTWYHVSGVYDAAAGRLDVYLNGQLDNGLLVGTLAASQSNSGVNVNIGRRSGKSGFQFAGSIDDVRIYDRALSQQEIQADMDAPLGTQGSTDSIPPAVTITGPANGTTVSGTSVTISAAASDNVAVSGVQFMLNGAPLGTEDISAPYSMFWNTTTVANGTYSITAVARDTSGNSAVSNPVTVIVSNVQSTSLTAGYAFDEGSGSTAFDASGNALNGSLVNGPVWGPGKYGSSLRLDGINDFVDLGNPAALQITGSMTISAWINSSAFPVDDAAIVSKRAAGEVGFQLDTTVDTGTRTIGFKLTGSSGGAMLRYGTTPLQTGTWYHIAGVYDAAAGTLDVYLNGQRDNGLLVGTVTAAQTNSAMNVNIGRRPGKNGFQFAGSVDDVRIYNRALTQSDIQADMQRPLGSSSQTPDAVPPQVSITFPQNNGAISGIITITAAATDNIAVSGVQFLLDGANLGPEDLSPPYGFSWDSRTAATGPHTISARARDAAGNVALSGAITVNVTNTTSFLNEVLITGLNLPTTLEFLPDGRMLIGELGGKIWVLRQGATEVDPVPFLELTNVGTANRQQGLMDIVLDPDFTTNGYYYIFYTRGSPNRDRVSRFTAAGATTPLSSEFVLWEDPDNADEEHHGGALNFGNDGKLYITTGEHFFPELAQRLTSHRGKILRINRDGTIPTDNPFYDGAGPNKDEIWALGLRNPFRATIDSLTGRFYIADVGGNNNATAQEELNIGIPGANYGWPNCEGTCGSPYTSPIYHYPHNGRDASITGGFIYRGSQFPAEYYGSYFFADYAQNWIKRLTFDASGNVSGVFNFEPLDGTPDGPYGDIVYLAEGPDGALYYVDLGWSDVTGVVGLSKIRRIRYVSSSNRAPIAAASANPLEGPAPLTVSFSSSGSADPEGSAISYFWNFGDNSTSTAANPVHTYAQAGQYTVRLTVSDGTTSALAAPITINAGNRPVPTIFTPADGLTFKAGDVISFSGEAVDSEDGVLPATAFSWQINFRHNDHIHPALPLTGTKSGSFQIPFEGHDYSGNTRYEIVLTVTDSSGLRGVQSVTVFPQKVNLTFSTVPAGLTVYVDGIARTTPFVYDTLVGFTHTIQAPNQILNTVSYAFSSWSDGGAQQHTVIVPAGNTALTATYTQTGNAFPPGLAANFGFNEGTGAVASDSSGNGNSALLQNGASWVPGRYGTALSFDGIDDFLSVVNSPSIDIAGTGLTLTLWINPQPLASGDSVILGKPWSNAMVDPYYQYGLELTAGNRPTFYIGTTSGLRSAFMGSTIPYGQWSHLGVVFDGSQVRFYVNGALVTARSLAAAIQARGNPATVGSDLRPAQFHRGAIDELRIYNRALSAGEIQADSANFLP